MRVFELESMRRAERAQRRRNGGTSRFWPGRLIITPANYGEGHFAYGLAAEHDGKITERAGVCSCEKICLFFVFPFFLFRAKQITLPELEPNHKQLVRAAEFEGKRLL